MCVSNKNCLLSGASGGIGEAIALALARAGARMTLVARDRSRLQALLQKLPGEGHRIIACDLTTTEGRQSLLQHSDDIDLLINNAGVNHFGLLGQQSETQLRQMLELNTLAPMLLTQALLPSLIARRGSIVNIGSGFGSIGFAGYCGYSASKFALRGFSEALRRELADSGVEVMYLAPRATSTAMNPDAVVALNAELGNNMDPPQRVADELLTQLKRKQPRRFIGWPERFFVKLNALLPSLVDRALSKQLPVIRRRALASHDSAG